MVSSPTISCSTYLETHQSIQVYCSRKPHKRITHKTEMCNGIATSLNAKFLNNVDFPIPFLPITLCTHPTLQSVSRSLTPTLTSNSPISPPISQSQTRPT